MNEFNVRALILLTVLHHKVILLSTLAELLMDVTLDTVDTRERLAAACCLLTLCWKLMWRPLFAFAVRDGWYPCVTYYRGSHACLDLFMLSHQFPQTSPALVD